MRISGKSPNTARARIGRALKVCAWGLALLAAACDQPAATEAGKEWRCALPIDPAPASYPAIGCLEDYRSLAAHPYDESMPGAFAVKVIVDRADGDRVHFLDSRKYKLHYPFAAEHLSGNGLPPVRSMADFVAEYHAPDRRFVLGTLAWYARPGIWTWELTPSDNAGADLIAMAHKRIADACFCGDALRFHATSLDIETEAAKLPASIIVTPSVEVYAGIDYQALNFAEGVGRLAFAKAADLKAGFAGPRDILVLDSVPDGIALAVAGLISQQFQTPLSHVNVLAQDRGTPNMGLRAALTDPALRALEGKWVKLKVDAFDYAIAEVGEAVAEAWRAAHPPHAKAVPAMDTSEGELKDVEDILDPALPLREAVKQAIPAFGGRTSHFAAFSRMDSAKVAYEPGFGIPVRYYLRHMRANGLFDSVDRMLADPEFRADAAERELRLENLRDAIVNAPVDTGFMEALNAKLDAEFPGIERFNFLASTNAGDLDSLSGAGIYAPRIGGRTDPMRALLEVWAGVWGLPAFEERSFRGIDHKAVGMGALVQAVAGGVRANGVALTANPFDPPCYEPGFYVNVGSGESPVTRQGAVDQFLYHYTIPGQPIVMLARANPVAPVLGKAQTYALGTALREIDLQFLPPGITTLADWRGMQTEFRLGRRAGAPPGADPVIIMTSVRPYGGWR